MTITIEGTIKDVTKAVAVQTKNGAKMKRAFTLETNEEYPQRLSVELFGDRVKAIDGFGVGDYVKVEADLRGRDWTNKDGVTKNFMSLSCWKIEKVPLGDEAEAVAPEVKNNFETDKVVEEPEDLPF